MLMRLTVIFLVAMSLVLPRTSAAIAAVAQGQISAFVICTSEGLRTVTLDAEGNPVDDGAGVESCPLIHGAVGPVAQAPLVWDRVPRVFAADRGRAGPPPLTPRASSHPARAPPAFA